MQTFYEPVSLQEMHDIVKGATYCAYIDLQRQPECLYIED